MTDVTAAEKQEAADAAAEQAAAIAAFSTTRGVEPPEPDPDAEADAKAAAEEAAKAAAAAAKVEPTAEEKAAQAARDKAAEDEWLKGAPASVRESLSAITALAGRVRNVEGHIGGLTSQQKELKATLEAAGKAAAAAGGVAPTAAEVAAAAGSSAKWKQMQEDFPEWAEAMEERLATVGRSSAAPVDVEKLRAQVRSEVLREVNFDRVEDVHEGWQDTVKKPEFAAWLKIQPEKTQALAASERPKDAIKLLDNYAESNKKAAPAGDPPADDSKARLEAAVAPTRGRAATKPEPITEHQAAEAAFKRIRNPHG